MGIEIDNLTPNEIIEQIFQRIQEKNPIHIVGVNVDQIVRVQNNPISKKIFQNASIVFVDGKPIKWMCRLLGTPIKERITGPDLMEYICQCLAQYHVRVFLLGAGPNVAAKCGDVLMKKYPGIIVSQTYSPPFGFENNPVEIASINRMLVESHSDILFVGMGSPKQDIFIYENMHIYNIPVSISMGAAIDFIAGNVKRAPKWMIRCGLEWLHRISQNPKRLWKRYLITDMAIIPMFFNEFIKKYNHGK